MSVRSNIKNHWKNASNWFKAHGVITGFLINLVLVIITCFSVYKTNEFSRKSITQTDSSLALTKRSLELAQSQLDFSKEQFDTLLRQGEIKDSIQNLNDKLQRETNLDQMEINRQVLSASKSQAKTAEEQYKFQLLVNNDQLYQNRPIFSLIKVEADTIKVKPDLYVSYYFQNIGKRPARIKKSILFLYNRKLNYFHGAKIDAGQTVNDKLMFLRTQQESRIVHYDSNTCYYVVLDYSDIETKSNLRYVEYFKVDKKANGAIQQISLSPEEKQIFLTKLAFKERADKQEYVFVPSN